MTNLEKETILLTNEAEHFYSIYTYNGKLQRKLSEYAQQFPEVCKLEKEDGNGGVTYIIDKDRVSINFKKPISEKQSKERSERMKATMQRVNSN